MLTHYEISNLLSRKLCKDWCKAGACWAPGSEKGDEPHSLGVIGHLIVKCLALEIDDLLWPTVHWFTHHQKVN